MEAILVTLFFVVVIILICIFILLGQPAGPARPGKVVSKWHGDLNNWYSEQTMHAGFFAVPHEPEEVWAITVEDDSGAHQDIYISKSEWSKLQVGDHYEPPK